MRQLVSGLAAVMLLLAACAVARADEEAVPLDKLPKAVSTAVKKKFPKAELVSASKEDMDGKPVYEVAIKAEDTTIDVTVTPEGKIVMIEKTIDAKDLPKAVAKAVESKYPKATYKKVEEVTKGDEIEKYEFLLVTKDKKTLEVSFDPKGKFLEEETKGEEKDEPKKDEKKGDKKDEKGDNKGKKGDEDEKKGDKKGKKGDDDDDEKGKKGKKGDEDEKGKGKKGDEDEKGKGKKDEGKSTAPKSVDLSKLPPDVAKSIVALVKELEKQNKGGQTKGNVKKGEEEEKKGEKKKKKDDDDDDDD
jgi:hypothetical protein